MTPFSESYFVSVVLCLYFGSGIRVCFVGWFVDRYGVERLQG